MSIKKVFKGNINGEVTTQLSSNWDTFTLELGAEYLFLFDKENYNPELKTFTRSLCDFQVAVNTSDSDFNEYDISLSKSASSDSSSLDGKTLAIAIVTIAGVLLSLVFLYQKRKRYSPEK